MISELSEEQVALVGVYQKKWSDKFFSLEFDEQKANEFVDFLYSLLGKPAPVKIVMDSPLGVQLAINLLKMNKKSRLDSQLSTQLYIQFDSQLDSQLYSQLASQLYSQLRSQLRSQLDSQLYSQLRSQLRSQLVTSLRHEKLDYYSFDWWGDTSEYGYLAFYDYVNHVLFPDYKNSVFEKYLELKTNINFLITFEGIAFISKPPLFINFDENNRLHYKSAPAVQYADGYKEYFIHGVCFEEDIFNKIMNKSITGEEILSLENAEQKAVIIQELGYETIINSLKNKIKVIDVQERFFNKNENEPVKYELLRFEMNNVFVHILKVEWYERDRFRQTFLGVPNNIMDAIEAVAWTCFKTKSEWENDLLMEA